jgi:hypothetical protein
LRKWPEDEAGIEVDVKELRALEGAFDEINTHELVWMEHVADPKTPPAMPPKDDLDSTEQTLCMPCSPLGKYQGIDVSTLFRVKMSGEVAHLVDRAVVKKLPQAHLYVQLGFLKLDDDHDTSSCNFVGVSDILLQLIDGCDGDSPRVALKFHSSESDPKTFGGGDGELAPHSRYAVELDVVFREAGLRDLLIERKMLKFDNVIDETLSVRIGNVDRDAVRVCVYVRRPAVFRYCVDWKFVKTAREWVDNPEESFGVDTDQYPDNTINPHYKQWYLEGDIIQTRARAALLDQ